MKKQRKDHTPEEKVAILRRLLQEKEPISKLCDELGLQPTVFYRWQKPYQTQASSRQVDYDSPRAISRRKPDKVESQDTWTRLSGHRFAGEALRQFRWL